MMPVAKIARTIAHSRQTARQAYGSLDHHEEFKCGYFVKKVRCGKCHVRGQYVRITKEGAEYLYVCQHCGHRGPCAKTVGAAKALWNNQQKESG